MEEIYQSQTLGEFLNLEFGRRKSRNNSYSLRAFARDLDLSASSLSEILRDTRGLSEDKIESVTERLKLKARDKEFLRDLVLSTSARNSKVREFAAKRLEEVRKLKSQKPIKEDQFKVISDWYHGAIVELIQLEDFQSDPLWISKRLGVPVSQVCEALVRLEKLGFIKEEENGYVTDPGAYDAIIERPSAAIRKFQRQVISMSLESLFADPGEEREILSMILALPKSQLPEFRQEMRKFVFGFIERIESLPKDDLYSFSLQLCPVKNRAVSGRSAN